MNVKVELGIFPDIQTQKQTYLFCTFSHETNGRRTLNRRKTREEEIKFSKRGDRKISFRTKIIDGKLVSEPRKQLIQI